MPVSIGTSTMPPPTPKRPPAMPAATPASTARVRSPPVTIRSGPCLGDARGSGALNHADGVREAGGVGGRPEHHGDQIAALGADPGREAIARFADEPRLAAEDLVAAVEQTVGVAQLVPAPRAREG